MSSSDPVEPARRATWAWTLVWALLAAGLVYAASRLDWAAVWATAAKARPGWLVAAVVLNLLNVPLWAGCWRWIAPSGKATGYLSLVRVLAVVLSAVQAFSLLAGGATAFLLLRRELFLSRPAALSLLVLDQLVTGLVKVLLLGSALIVMPDAPHVLRQVGIGLLAAMGVGTVALIEASRSRGRLLALSGRIGGRAGHWLTGVAEELEHLAAVRSFPRMSAAILFMLARRLAEGLAAYAVAISIGVPVGPEFILIVVASLAIVTLIPSPPGNVGVYEVAVVAAYGWLGVQPEVAVAAALLQHAAFLVSALPPGALLVLWPGTEKRR